MNFLAGLEKLLGIGGAKAAAPPTNGPITESRPTLMPTQHAALPLLHKLAYMHQRIPVQSVEGHYPQDPSAPMSDPTDVLNYLQTAYQNPQTSIHGGYQQNQGLDGFGNPRIQTMQNPANPFGWSTNPNAGVIARFPGQ